MFAEMLESYGSKANLHSTVSEDTVTEKNIYSDINEKGRPFKALLRELLTVANEYAADAAKLNHTLDTKIVNGLGQTAQKNWASQFLNEIYFRFKIMASCIVCKGKFRWLNECNKLLKKAVQCLFQLEFYILVVEVFLTLI
jgi:hypothetical protein